MIKHCACKIGVALTAGSLLFAPSAFAATNGATALLVGGEGSYAVLTEEQMSTAFGGYFANYDQRISVPFPGDAPFEVSVLEGSDNLYNALYEHQANLGTPVTIGGVSKGAASVVNVLYRLLEDYEEEGGATPPRSGAMTVAIYGAPGRAFFLTVRHEEVPETPWDTLLVSTEYDGIADLPDNLFNILAVLNAIKGAELRHVDGAFYDVANNPVIYREVIGEKYGAKTTYVVIPTERLPLLHDMYESDVWSPSFVNWLETVLRPIVDSGYKRNWYSQRDVWKEGTVALPPAPTDYSTPDGDPLPPPPAPEPESAPLVVTAETGDLTDNPAPVIPGPATDPTGGGEPAPSFKVAANANGTKDDDLEGEDDLLTADLAAEQKAAEQKAKEEAEREAAKLKEAAEQQAKEAAEKEAAEQQEANEPDATDNDNTDNDNTDNDA